MGQLQITINYNWCLFSLKIFQLKLKWRHFINNSVRGEANSCNSASFPVYNFIPSKNPSSCFPIFILSAKREH